MGMSCGSIICRLHRNRWEEACLDPWAECSGKEADSRHMGSNRAWHSRDINLAHITNNQSMHNRIKQLQHRHNREIQGNSMHFKDKDIHSADCWCSIVAEQTLDLVPFTTYLLSARRSKFHLLGDVQ